LILGLALWKKLLDESEGQKESRAFSWKGTFIED
jgi:hypothetical protein